jgi:hypothetical protein
VVFAVALLGASGGALDGQEVIDLQADDRTLSAAFDEVFRVGSFDGEEWETFGDVAGVAFDAEGNMYVFDGQSSRVVMVDPTGAFVREIGQPGEGPGELRMPMGFTVLRDGSVVIADMGHRAYSVFAADGSYERSVSMGGNGMMIRIGDMFPDPRGGAVYTGGGNTVVAMSGGPGMSAPDEPTTRPIERMTFDGDETAAETVVEAWLPPRADPAELSGGGMSFRMSVTGPRTFEPGLYMGVLADGGVAFADSSTYTVKVTDAEGVVQRVMRRPFQPRPVTEAVEEAEKERQLADLEEGNGPQLRMMSSSGGGSARAIGGDAIKEMMRGRIDQMQFYPELPVLMNLTTGWNGKIWVVRRGEEPTEAGAIDVLTPAGQYVGTFAADALSLPTAFGPDGLVAFVETDEFDVPTVVVRRLPAILR